MGAEDTQRLAVKMVGKTQGAEDTQRLAVKMVGKSP